MRGLHRAALSAGTALLVSTTVAEGQAPPPLRPPLEGYPSFEDLLELRSVSLADLSADGRKVAFVIGSMSVHGQSPPAELHVWDEARGDRVVATSADGEIRDARWLPDGTALAVLDFGAEGARLKILPVEDGPRGREIDLPVPGVESFALSPDGTEAILNVRENPTDRASALQDLYGPYLEEDAPFAPVHLWLLSLENGSVRRLTAGDFTVYQAVWSPTRRELAVVTGPPLETSSWWRRDLYRLDIATGGMVPLATDRGAEESPVWSPDGTQVAFLTTRGDTITTAPPWVAVLPRMGGVPRILTDTLSRIPELSGWDAAGILLWLQDGVRAGFSLVDPDRPGGLVALTPDTLMAWPGSPATAGGAFAFLAATGSTLDELYWQAGPGSPVRRLTDVSSSLRGVPLGTRKMVRWNGPDGVPVEGVLHTPDGFDPARRYPLLVVIHGGPRSTSFPALNPTQGAYPILHWLWKGALVLEPNYRGSIGYGRAFRELHHRHLGTGDGGDVLAGVASLVDAGFVDADRVGVMGWSYGGFLSAYLSVTTDVFAAASVGAGITDWKAHYGWESEYLTTRFFSFGATPWEDPEAYRRASPLEHLSTASTPTLIQHVTGDPIVPALGARALYRGLRDHGVETRLIFFPGETHFPRRPTQIVGALWQNWQWFLRHLWGEVVESPISESP